MPNRRQSDPTNGAVEIYTMEPGNILRITEVIGFAELRTARVCRIFPWQSELEMESIFLRITLQTVSLGQVDWELPWPNFCLLSGKKNGLRGLYSLGAADLVVNATPRFMI